MSGHVPAPTQRLQVGRSPGLAPPVDPERFAAYVHRRVAAYAVLTTPLDVLATLQYPLRASCNGRKRDPDRQIRESHGMWSQKDEEAYRAACPLPVVHAVKRQINA